MQINDSRCGVSMALAAKVVAHVMIRASQKPCEEEVGGSAPFARPQKMFSGGIFQNYVKTVGLFCSAGRP